MKKLFTLVLVFLAFWNILAQDGNSEKIRVAIDDKTTEPALKSISSQVKTKLESNFRRYTNFSVVASDEEARESVARQRAAEESGIYDEDTLVSAGEMKRAQYLAEISVQSNDNNYILYLVLKDETTGEKYPFEKSCKNNADSLYLGRHCAVDQIILEMNEDKDFSVKFKISLTQSEIQVLKFGDLNLSTTERMDANRKEYEDLQAKITAFDAEISALSLDKNVEAMAKVERIKAEKTLAEENLKTIEEQKIKLLEEEKRKQEEQERSLKDEHNNNAKVEKASKEADKKLNQIRQMTFENSNILEKIQIIETKKSSVIDIRNDVKDYTKKTYDLALVEIESAKSKIDAEEFRKSETKSDGTPIQKAIENREKRKQIEENRILEKADNDSKKYESSVKEQELAIINQIEEDYKKIAKTQYVNSLGEDLYISYGSFDGEKQQWPVTITWYSENKEIFEYEYNLKYSDVVGKSAPNKMETPEWEEYSTNIDFYERLFLRGDKIFIYELEYTIEPAEENKPSVYYFTVGNVNVHRIEELKVNSDGSLTSKTKKSELIDKTYPITYTPVHDLRTDDKIKEEEEKIRIAQELEEAQRQKEEERQLKEEQQRQLAEERQEKKERIKRSNREKYDWAYGQKAFLSLDLGGSVPYSRDFGVPSIDISLALGVPIFYFKGAFNIGLQEDSELIMLYNADIILNKEKDNYIDSDTKAFDILGGIGTSFRIHLFQVFHPRFFGEVLFGARALEYKKMNLETREIEFSNNFLMILQAGAEIPLGRSVAINGGYRYNLNLIGDYWYTTDAIYAAVSFAYR